MQNGIRQATEASSDRGLRAAACAWLARLSSGDMADREMTEFKRWLAADPEHRTTLEREAALWRDLENLKGEFESPPVAQPHTDKRPHRAAISASRTLRWSVAGLVAACMAFVAISADVLTRLRTDVGTSVGEIRRVTLPDGSLAVLNTNTALAIDFNATERGVALLKGEAWFQVVKNASRPFRVRTSEGMAEAVGTAFSVRAEPDRVTVAVTEGTVAVSPESQGTDISRQVTHVTQSQQVAYSSSAISTPTAFQDAAAQLAWRDGRLLIEDTTLSAALDELDRYRPGNIILLSPNLANARVSGIFSIDKIDQGLEGLAATYGFRITHVTPFVVLIR